MVTFRADKSAQPMDGRKVCLGIDLASRVWGFSIDDGPWLELTTTAPDADPTAIMRLNNTLCLPGRKIRKGMVWDVGPWPRRGIRMTATDWVDLAQGTVSSPANASILFSEALTAYRQLPEQPRRSPVDGEHLFAVTEADPKTKRKRYLTYLGLTTVEALVVAGVITTFHAFTNLIDMSNTSMFACTFVASMLFNLVLTQTNDEHSRD